MPLTTAGKNLALNWMFTTGSVTRPVDWSMRLHTASPGAAGTANELSTGVDADYEPQALTFSASTVGSSVSSLEAEFTAASGATTHTITHVSVWDDANAVCLAYGELLIPRVRVASAPLTFAVGDAVINLP